MTVRNFWRVFLKSLGLWMAIESISLALNYISVMVPASDDLAGFNVMSAIFLLGICAGVVCLLLRFTLVKTEWLIDKLSLEKGFTQEKLDINISPQTMLAIVISVIGGLSFISALPDFIRSLYSFYQQEYIFRQSPEASRILYSFVRCIVGFVLMTNGGYFSQLLIRKNEAIPAETTDSEQQDESYLNS